MKSNLTVMCVIAILMTGATAIAAETVRWIPAAASNDGAFGTRWTTTLWVHSMATDADIEVYASFYPNEGGVAAPAEVAITVPPTRPLEILDMVAELFEESRAGAVRLRSAHPFEARSRTSNNGGAGGSFGQGIPAVNPDEALPFGALIGAANIPGDDGVRTNLGILNPGDQAANIWVFVTKEDAEGELEYFATHQITVGAGGWTQDNVFRLAGDESRVVENAWVVVAADGNPDQPENRVVSYLSRIDNRSGDAVYIEPFLNPVHWVDPDSIEVQYSVAAPDGFSLYSVTYPDDMGETVTIFDPPADWSMDGLAALGETVCLQVTAKVESEGSDPLEACIEGRLGASTDFTCSQCAGDPGDLCQFETCRFLY